MYDIDMTNAVDLIVTHCGSWVLEVTVCYVQVAVWWNVLEWKKIDR